MDLVIKQNINQQENGNSAWSHNMANGAGSPFQNKIAKLIVNDVEVTSVVVPQTVIQIQPGNWRGARLTSCTFHQNVTSIGNYAFADCNNLIIQDLNLPNLLSLGSYAFKATKIQAISDLGNITSIGANCFENCTRLASVAIPNTVTEIETFAFAGTGVTSVTVPSGVTKIGVSAWRYCNSLTSVTISDTVTSIGTCAFSDSPNLRTVVIGSGVQTIDFNVFDPSKALTSLTCKAVTPPTLNRDDSIPRNTTYPIYVPAGSVDAYKTADIWKNHASQIQAITNS